MKLTKLSTCLICLGTVISGLSATAMENDKGYVEQNQVQDGRLEEIYNQEIERGKSGLYARMYASLTVSNNPEMEEIRRGMAEAYEKEIESERSDAYAKKYAEMFVKYKLPEGLSRSIAKSHEIKMKSQGNEAMKQAISEFEGFALEKICKNDAKEKAAEDNHLMNQEKDSEEVDSDLEEIEEGEIFPRLPELDWELDEKKEENKEQSQVIVIDSDDEMEVNTEQSDKISKEKQEKGPGVATDSSQEAMRKRMEEVYKEEIEAEKSDAYARKYAEMLVKCKLPEGLSRSIAKSHEIGVKSQENESIKQVMGKFEKLILERFYQDEAKKKIAGDNYVTNYGKNSGRIDSDEESHKQVTEDEVQPRAILIDLDTDYEMESNTRQKGGDSEKSLQNIAEAHELEMKSQEERSKEKTVEDNDIANESKALEDMDSDLNIQIDKLDISLLEERESNSNPDKEMKESDLQSEIRIGTGVDNELRYKILYMYCKKRIEKKSKPYALGYAMQYYACEKGIPNTIRSAQSKKFAKIYEKCILENGCPEGVARKKAFEACNEVYKKQEEVGRDYESDILDLVLDPDLEAELRENEGIFFDPDMSSREKYRRICQIKTMYNRKKEKENKCYALEYVKQYHIQTGSNRSMKADKIARKYAEYMSTEKYSPEEAREMAFGDLSKVYKSLRRLEEKVVIDPVLEAELVSLNIGEGMNPKVSDKLRCRIQAMYERKKRERNETYALEYIKQYYGPSSPSSCNNRTVRAERYATKYEEYISKEHCSPEEARRRVEIYLSQERRGRKKLEKVSEKTSSSETVSETSKKSAKKLYELRSSLPPEWELEERKSKVIAQKNIKGFIEEEGKPDSVVIGELAKKEESTSINGNLSKKSREKDSENSCTVEKRQKSTKRTNKNISLDLEPELDLKLKSGKSEKVLSEPELDQELGNEPPKKMRKIASKLKSKSTEVDPDSDLSTTKSKIGMESETETESETESETETDLDFNDEFYKEI